jgi:hypothetical protein
VRFLDNEVSTMENRELRERLKQQKLEGEIDQSITGGHQVTWSGEDRQKEVGMKDILAFEEEMEKKYGKREIGFGWKWVTTAGLYAAAGGAVYSPAVSSCCRGHL